MDDMFPMRPVGATPSAVHQRLARDWESDGEILLVESLLDEAWSYLLGDVPTLEDRLESEPRLGALASHVLVSAVTRVMRNPEGWRQVGIDDFQGTRDTVLSAGLLQFTEEELARLQPRQYGVPGYFNMPLSVPYWGQ